MDTPRSASWIVWDAAPARRGPLGQDLSAVTTTKRQNNKPTATNTHDNAVIRNSPPVSYLPVSPNRSRRRRVIRSPREISSRTGNYVQRTTPQTKLDQPKQQQQQQHDQNGSDHNDDDALVDAVPLLLDEPSIEHVPAEATGVVAGAREEGLGGRLWGGEGEENNRANVEWERQHLLKALFSMDDGGGGERSLNVPELIERIRTYPAVTRPVVLRRRDHQIDLLRPKCNLPVPSGRQILAVGRNMAERHIQDCGTTQYEAEVCEKTILGALCSAVVLWTSASAKQLHLLQELICTVITLCPLQIGSHQGFVGHTALRDAVCNPSCPMGVIELLVRHSQQPQPKQQREQESVPSDVVFLPDRDGMSPVDHLLHAVQLGPDSKLSVHRLAALLKHASPHTDAAGTTTTLARSPLIYILSLGTSFGVTPVATSVVASTPASILERSHVPSRLNCLLEACRVLLNWNPGWIQTKARASDCSPLHVAIRNYGNFTPIIRELMDRDGCAESLLHRNRFGDLPLHVACSVGVPMDILHLVLARTLQAAGPVPKGPHPLIWSTNRAGYTPVDLEWIRHIEAGHNFFSHRSFYPLDARGVRKLEGQCDDLYDELLRQAVDQALGHSPGTITRSNGRNRWERTRQAVVKSVGTDSTTLDGAFGLLLHRIFLIIRASFRDSFSRSPFDLSGDILHQSSGLCGQNGPILPRPILELILWQHPEQIDRRDHTGKLPLHYAVESRRIDEKEYVKYRQEWQLWVQKLLRHSPGGCTVMDHVGRLPLHYALACRRDSACNTIARDLVSHCPQSLHFVDPLTKLLPYQLAAQNPSSSLDTVFFLLRQCPGVVDERCGRLQ
jgi:hypothetical protein